MPPKRPSAGASASGTPPAAKHPKTESTRPEDFSDSVKRKLASSKRTGQACDRCKVRKIRCDGTVNGACKNCKQVNQPCRTTDRITGRATERGYVDTLERDFNVAVQFIRDYETQLTALGVDIKPFDLKVIRSKPDEEASLQHWDATAVNDQSQVWAADGGLGPTESALASFGHHSGSTTSPDAHDPNMFRAVLPVLKPGCNGDNYLGVSSGLSSLSAIRGTALSVLGMEIDIADFSSSDVDEPLSPGLGQGLYNKSYQSFLRSAMNVNPKVEKVNLPPKDSGLTYSLWYLRVLNPYIPVLHEPTFTSLVSRMYDDPDFKPTPAQTVMVHMVFAIMFFQYAARNYENAEQQANLNAQSNLHYHYSLGFYHQLVSSHGLEDLQALTLICAHLRNFPKPGASWMVTNTTLTLAVELGLHRSAKRWAQALPQTNALEIEMRKRVFWSLLAIHVTLSGKLGRPMPMGLQDFDVELPDAVDDDLLSEDSTGESKEGKCAFRVGIEGFKVTLLYLELFSTLYAARRNPSIYLDTVNRLEAKILRWRDQWPMELRQDPIKKNQEIRVFALYSELYALEFRILLRHPAVSMTSSPEFNAESLNICLNSAREMLKIVKVIRHYKSLDTTWYSGAVLLMAITITLYAQWQRRSQITAVDIANLREEMTEWADIMAEVSVSLGSGTRLREAVETVTEHTIGMLNTALASNATTAAASVAGPTKHESRSRSRSPINESNRINFNNHGFSSTYPDPATANGSINGPPRGDYLSPSTGLNGYNYPEPGTGQTLSYPTEANLYANAGYPGPDGSLPSNSLSGSGSTISTSQPANNAYSLLANSMTSAAAANPSFQSTAPTWNIGSQSWQHWADTMTGSLEPQERYSASALMQLGGRDMGAADSNNNNSTAAAASHASVPVADMGGSAGSNAVAGDHVSTDPSGQATWPLGMFNT